KSFVSEKPDLIDRIMARMVAEHAEMRSKTARKTPVSAECTIHHRERGGPCGAHAQKFPPVEHLQKLSGSQDRPPGDPLQGPTLSLRIFQLMERPAGGSSPERIPQ